MALSRDKNEVHFSYDLYNVKVEYEVFRAFDAPPKFEREVGARLKDETFTNTSLSQSISLFTPDSFLLCR